MSLFQDDLALQSEEEEKRKLLDEHFDREFQLYLERESRARDQELFGMYDDDWPSDRRFEMDSHMD